jgi:cysteine desulfurase family protein (TIGR01976 family)
MTTLTFAISRSLAREWRAGDEVVVTRLDHDANVTPWVMAAEEAGATVKTVDIDPVDCTLDRASLTRALSDRTRLVAVTAASNAAGTVTPLAEIASEVHAAGGELFVDAVHFAPHRLIDVPALGCDYLVCSPYKFFGPHLGMMWGRKRRMQALHAYKVRPADDQMPHRFESGTQSHEGIAGALAAIDYLASLAGADADADRRARLRSAFAAIESHESALCRQLLAGLDQLPGYRVWGITDPARLAERVPTVSITHRELAPNLLAQQLSSRGIFAWYGNYYALELSRALGREPDGMVRLGILHYNSAEEIDRLLEVLAELDQQ